jgi:hypothetical protein
MATEIQSWQIVSGKLVSVKANMIEEKKRKRRS